MEKASGDTVSTFTATSVSVELVTVGCATIWSQVFSALLAHISRLVLATVVLGRQRQQTWVSSPCCLWPAGCIHIVKLPVKSTGDCDHLVNFSAVSVVSRLPAGYDANANMLTGCTLSGTFARADADSEGMSQSVKSHRGHSRHF